MSKAVVEKLASGDYVINGPVVFTCGCGDVSVKTRNLVRNAGVDFVAVISTPNNNNARGFIKKSGLSEVEPSLKKGKYAVLYHPDTMKFINLLNVNNDSNILANIYKVATGQ